MNTEEVILYPQTEQVMNAFIHQFWKEKQKLTQKRVCEEITDAQIEQLKCKGIPQESRPLEEVMEEMTEEIFKYRYNANHPRYLGFVPGPASSLSWLGDVMTSAYNLHAGSWMNCPAASCIEHALLAWFCRQAGFTGDSKGINPGGIFVSGGSMANMTALIAARNKLLSDDTQHLGTAYVSEQTHSSVAKDLRIIGVTDKRIRKIPTDAHFRMDMRKLQSAIREDIAAGFIPFVVIASAGTTNTGSIDPMEEISALCQKYGIWMHVDGAYGASILLSKKYRHLLNGVEKADSLSWDAHKWLFQTYGCGMTLVKNRNDLFNSFSANPEYLHDLAAENEHFNAWDMGVELTRPARGLRLWLTLQVLGQNTLSDAIEHGIQIAEYAEKELQKTADIEILSPAQLAILTFRFAPNHLSEKEKDELNQKISKKMLENGYAGIFTTQLAGRKVLRICAIHPDTSEADIRSTVSLLNQFYQELCPKKM